jgi:SulP family sulfate permease
MNKAGIIVSALLLSSCAEAFTNTFPHRLHHGPTTAARTHSRQTTHLYELTDFLNDPALQKALRTDVYQLYGPPKGNGSPQQNETPDTTQAPPPTSGKARFRAAYDTKTAAAAAKLTLAMTLVKETVKKTPLLANPEIITSQLESIVTNAKRIIPFEKVQTIQSELLKPKYKTFVSSSAAGLAVALTMLPQAIAASTLAGVNPLVGIWTTVLMGFAAAALGGRAGVASSVSTSALVVVAALCASKGPQYLSACAIVAGILQMVGGVVGVGKFIRLVPHPVMLGFINGLAILMTKTQLLYFSGINWASPIGTATVGVMAATIAIVKLLPRVTRVVPPSVAAVFFVSSASALLKLPVQTLSDVAGAATFAGGWNVLPKLALPSVPFTLETLTVVLPYALTMALVGAIESLLTMQIVDGMVDDGHRGSTKQELIGQGVGNVASAMFGGIGGSAVLGQSIVNVQSGGAISRWSGMSMAIFLAFGIVVAAPLLGSIPIASLAGIMLLVCQSTFSWSSLRLFNKVPKMDLAIIALTSIVTVRKNLAQAVFTGTIVSALDFAWKKSKILRVVAFEEPRNKLYRLDGPLFFGSVDSFDGFFDPKNDPTTVVLDFSNCRVHDHSALEAICKLAQKYAVHSKQLVVRRVSQDTAQLLKKLYPNGALMVEVSDGQDPAYQVAEESRLYGDLKLSM